MIFIDNHTRFTKVFLITDKFEVYSVFQNFYHTIETQFNTKLQFFKVKMVVSFKTIPLVSFCPSNGLFTRACVLTPLNKMGLPSEKNFHLLDVARSLMLSTSLLICGEMFLLQLISSIGCLLVFTSKLP